MAINQIVTPLDAAILDSKEQYALYFKMMEHSLNELIQAFKKYYICSDQESVFFKQYTELLNYSVEAMRIKYLYDEEEFMKIDLTDSGFPNYLEFRYLYNDLLLKHEHIEKLPSADALKADFLNHIMKQKIHIPEEKLHQAASIIYYTTIDQNLIFKRFVQGKIIPTEENDATYLVSWSFYDITSNRPFICYMYFDYNGKKIEEYTAAIYEVLRSTADRYMDLGAMGYGIDKKLTKLKPKKIRRIDIGPLHSVFAKDENIITHALISSIAKKEIDLSSFALSMHIDEIQTKGTFKEGKFLANQELQLWDSETTEDYLFAPHRIIQLLHAKLPMFLDTLTTKPFTFNPIINTNKPASYGA